MKRWAIPAAILLLIVCALSQPAMDPEDFSGQWYSSREQCIYLFRGGIIYCRKYPILLSEEASISGAYTFSGESVYLFAEGIEGLESPRELFLVEHKEESLLCENKDGSGQIFFVRDNKGK